MVIWVLILNHSLVNVHLALMVQVVIVLRLDHLVVMFVIDLMRQEIVSCLIVVTMVGTIDPHKLCIAWH